jgi:hypothetical protein
MLNNFMSSGYLELGDHVWLAGCGDDNTTGMPECLGCKDGSETGVSTRRDEKMDRDVWDAFTGFQDKVTDASTSVSLLFAVMRELTST